MTLSPWRLLPLCAIFVGACTWVKPEPGAEAVELVEPQAVVGCDYLGRASGKTKDRVLINRKSSKVAAEVLTLARNEAAQIGGNRLVALGELEQGEQTFAVYRCPN